MFGVSMVGVPAVVNVSMGNTVAVLTQAKKRPQELAIAVTIAGVDCTSNTTYFKCNNLEAMPGSALLKLAGAFAMPTAGDTVVIDYALSVDGAEYLGRLFSGVVEDTTTPPTQRGEIAVTNVVCREVATSYALQSPPVSVVWSGTAHDLARVELAALGLVGVLDFEDFDIYAGDPLPTAFLRWRQPSLRPSSQFATVERLLLWMVAQTSFGVISTDSSGVVRVNAFDSTRAADHVYAAQGIISTVAGVAPTTFARPQYGQQQAAWWNWGGWVEAQRPAPIVGETDYAAKVSDYAAVDATLAAFLADAANATYHDVVVTLNPAIIPGHRMTFVTAAGATVTGTVRGVSHEGQWPGGFLTTVNAAVMP